MISFCITKVKFRHKCYWNQQLLLAGCSMKRGGMAFLSDVPTKIASSYNFLAISRQLRFHPTKFWKVLRQINPYVSNKWPLKLPCAYLKTQESRNTGTP
ncbi:hypothetical protein T07_14624 [Trichinella nelsoni]|uniref:Uncharacterized protein n=1 Tax=Trichinella nelsoni TaxID=6336 RepID=A0A0V0RJS7_9BILA|nr:hypothetical protein T07_14624 [Trichinella nelsoni]